MGTFNFLGSAVSAIAYPLRGDRLADTIMSLLTVALPVTAAIHAIPRPGVGATAFQIILFLGSVVVFAFFGNKIVYDWHALVRASAEGHDNFFSPGYIEGRAEILQDRAPGTVLVLVVIGVIFRLSPITLAALIVSFAFIPIINLHGMGFADLRAPAKFPLSYSVVALSEVILWAPLLVVAYHYISSHQGPVIGRLSYIPTELAAGVLAFQTYWGWVNARVQGRFVHALAE